MGDRRLVPVNRRRFLGTAAAATVGFGVHDLGVPFHGPAPAAAAGLADRAWQTVDNPGSSAVPADSNAPVTGPSEAAFSAAVAFRVRVDSHLRQGPGMQHGVGAVFKAGTRVTASGSAGQWVRVSGPDGRQGWIYRKLLEPPQ